MVKDSSEMAMVTRYPKKKKLKHSIEFQICFYRRASQMSEFTMSSKSADYDPETDANRGVNLKKLFTVVRVKNERSEKGKAFVLYCIWTAFYITAIVLQRKANYAAYVNTGIRTYLTSATFRDPNTFEVCVFLPGRS